jgi:hypothetical protein
MSASMEVIDAGATAGTPLSPFRSAGASSCANEFHALQSGQRPSHFGDWLPHSVQEKTTVFFGTK